jgi:hypothetical protein
VQDKDSSLMLANGSEIPIQASGSGPPKIASLHAFMSSCVNVIFPLLMGQPAALAQWFALAASVLLAAKKDWPHANEYLTQLLQERVTERKEFADPSQTVLTTLAFVGAASTTASSVSSHSHGGAQRPGGGSMFCEAHNWSQNGCIDPCPYGKKHECQFAERGCGATKSHPSRLCTSKRPGGGGSQGSNGAYRGGRGGYHGKKGGQGGSSGSSVSTTKPTSSA